MALINDTYVFVSSEDFSKDYSVSEHPVEEGIPLTDHVKREAIPLNLTGKIVGDDYEDVIDEIQGYSDNCELVEYVGRNIMSGALITSFHTTADASIRDGVAFTATLMEVRIASSPYTAATGDIGLQQVTEGQSDEGATASKTYEVRPGDTLWKISEAYYGNGSQYPKIVAANSDKISNPDVIVDGWMLNIP